MSNQRTPEILSHDALRAYLDRNNRESHWSLPEYESVYRGAKRMPQSDADLRNSWAKYVGRLGHLRLHESHAAWVARLDSKQWRVQMRGSKEARLVMRVVRISQGIKRGWDEVPLNSRAYGSPNKGGLEGRNSNKQG